MLAAILLMDGGNDALTEAKAMTGGDREVSGIAPARDGEIAVREEFELALAKGTADALELFIRRHPGHPLAREARRMLEEGQRGSGRNGAATGNWRGERAGE